MTPYKGYTGTVEYDDVAMLFHGEVAGIRDVVTFQARTAEDLRKAFEDSVDDYLDFCRNENVEPQKPFSGTLSLRTSPELHQRIAAAAARRSASINQWIVETLERQATADLDHGTTSVR
ncbi:type II toxin-antitoxin system HicB family antitoxin [Jiella pelagia]|nr:type II toxin-antitoxin system HicB family antitoxin [Jiella pelagia]